MKDNELILFNEWLWTKDRHELISFLIDVAWKDMGNSTTPQHYKTRFSAENAHEIIKLHGADRA